jgi:hypothetical protein
MGRVLTSRERRWCDLERLGTTGIKVYILKKIFGLIGVGGGSRFLEKGERAFFVVCALCIGICTRNTTLNMVLKLS